MPSGVVVLNLACPSCLECHELAWRSGLCPEHLAEKTAKVTIKEWWREAGDAK